MSFKNIGSASFIAAAPYPIILAMQLFFARSLSVSEIGQFALFNFVVISFITITNWGVDKFIIANKDISTKKINEIFTFELLFSILLFSFFFLFLREIINNYIGLKDSFYVWAMLSLIFLYSPFTRSKALLEKDMRLIYANMPLLIANLVSAILGIVMVFLGYGIWSMIIWRLSIYAIEILILILVAPKRPSIVFGFSSYKLYFYFCAPLYFGAILSFISVTADIWIVNNLLGPEELGFYWLAFSLSHILLSLRLVINRILLPSLASLENLQAKKLLFNKLNSFLQLIMTIILIVVTFWSKDILIFLLGEKWLEAIPLFKILIIASIIKVISGTANPLLHSSMKTGIDLNVSIVNVLVLIPLVIFFTFNYGIIGTSISVLISSLIMTFYVFENHIRRHIKAGFFRYFSFVLVNIIFLSIITLFTAFVEVLSLGAVLPFLGLLTNSDIFIEE